MYLRSMSAIQNSAIGTPQAKGSIQGRQTEPRARCGTYGRGLGKTFMNNCLSNLQGYMLYFEVWGDGSELDVPAHTTSADHELPFELTEMS